MTARLTTDAVERARSVRLEDEVARRGIKLKRVSSIERAGPCPKCGGTDRFSINTRKAVWNCRHCNHGGDVIALVIHIDGVSFSEAVERLTGQRPHAPPDKPADRPPAPTPADAADIAKTSAARRLWGEAGPIEGTIAERYLIQARHLEIPEGVSGRVLRFHSSCPFGAEKHPCLVALYRTIADDTPVAIHRTALSADGRKIDRKMLGPVRSAAIKLTADADVTYGLTIGEGIETTIAGMMRGYSPAWALGAAGGIKDFPVLAGVDCLTIITDHDDAGIVAAQTCRKRWNDAGREVMTVMSPSEGEDVDDLRGLKT
jgi:hypothetical protein